MNIQETFAKGLQKSLILFVSQSTAVLYNRTCTPFAPLVSMFSQLYRGLQWEILN